MDSHHVKDDPEKAEDAPDPSKRKVMNVYPSFACDAAYVAF
jgi:hypothetical protein